MSKKSLKMILPVFWWFKYLKILFMVTRMLIEVFIN